MTILGITDSSRPKAVAAFESIASATGTGSSGTITFSSIPSTYRHLQIRMIARNASAGTGAAALNLRLGNSTIDSGSNYTRHDLRTDGATVTASGNAPTTEMTTNSACVVQNGAAANLHGVIIIDINDYQSTSKYKTVRMLSGNERNGAGELAVSSGLWMSTSACDTLQVFQNQNFLTSTVVALYGIKGS